jgi:hypothetical protein
MNNASEFHEEQGVGRRRKEKKGKKGVIKTAHCDQVEG